MRLAANYNRDFNLEGATSIRAALELLSDKDPEEQQGDLIDVEAERLAHGKAAEAVRHATNCGLMLLQIKAGLNHGEWLPWLNGEIESGRLKVKSRQARSYMRLASNWQRAANLTDATSIRAALELLSDKDPEEQQGDLIDVEAERLAHGKAAEAVRHATNCGLMLLQIKAGLNHGEWLPWLKRQQESGAIDFSESTAKRYMRVAANRSRVTDLEAPSIRAALELLSDKEPEEQQGDLIDVEAERQARK